MLKHDFNGSDLFDWKCFCVIKGNSLGKKGQRGEIDEESPGIPKECASLGSFIQAKKFGIMNNHQLFDHIMDFLSGEGLFLRFCFRW